MFNNISSIEFLAITGIIALMFVIGGISNFGRDFEMRKQAEYNAIEMKKQGLIKVVPQVISTP